MAKRKPRYATYTQGDYTDTLYQAVLAGRYDAVESLLDGGVSPDVLRGALSPLHVAIAQEDARIADLLIAFGADVNARCTTQNLTPLMLAAAQNCPDLCQRLIDAKANVDAVNDSGMSALMIAVVEGSAPITSMLTSAGANLFLRNTRDQMAYDLALRHGHSECAAILYGTMCLPRLHRPRTLQAPRLPFFRKKG